MSGFDTERFDHIAVSDWRSSTDRRTTMTDESLQLTIRAANGGADATDFAGMLVRMYLAWAERSDLTVEIVQQDDASVGVALCTMRFSGSGAAGLATEEGVHRLVRISPHDPQRRRTTTFVDVVTDTASKEESWGDQTRSYVLDPYTLVKTHPHGPETPDAEAVLAGDLSCFIPTAGVSG